MELHFAIKNAILTVALERNPLRADLDRLPYIQGRIEARIEKGEPHDLVFAEETRTL